LRSNSAPGYRNVLEKFGISIRKGKPAASRLG
jgi:hypothetical protein